MTGEPKRVQMTRRRPWRADHPDAVVVDRRTKWGNPFSLTGPRRCLVRYGPEHEERFGRAWDYEGRISGHGQRHDMYFSSGDIVQTSVRWAMPAETIELFRLTILDPTPGMVMAYPSRRGHFLKATLEEIVAELRGRDLACWCALDQPCHADVLLELANRSADG